MLRLTRHYMKSRKRRTMARSLSSVPGCKLDQNSRRYPWHFLKSAVSNIISEQLQSSSFLSAFSSAFSYYFTAQPVRTGFRPVANKFMRYSSLSYSLRLTSLSRLIMSPADLSQFCALKWAWARRRRREDVDLMELMYWMVFSNSPRSQRKQAQRWWMAQLVGGCLKWELASSSDTPVLKAEMMQARRQSLSSGWSFRSCLAQVQTSLWSYRLAASLMALILSSVLCIGSIIISLPHLHVDYWPTYLSHSSHLHLSSRTLQQGINQLTLLRLQPIEYSANPPKAPLTLSSSCYWIQIGQSHMLMFLFLEDYLLLILIVPLQKLLMNLSVFKYYLSFLARSEATLEQNRSQLDLSRNNAYSFYKLIATKSQPLIDRTLLTTFIRTFTYNFQVQHPQELAMALVQSKQYQLLPSEDNHSQQTLMAKGVDLFLKKWSTTGCITFEQFAGLLGDEQQTPERAREVQFPLKKKFYQLVEDEIQTLLDGETFRKAVSLEYRNLVDLFEMLSDNGEFGMEEARNVFLMVGERKPDNFFQKISKRIPLPLDETQFKEWFTVTSTARKYSKQTKIFYSSIKRKKQEGHYDDDLDDRFMTPNVKTAAVGMSSTKMTKGERLHSTRRLQEVSRFTFDRQASAAASTAILADILAQQERLTQMKRQLLYRPDYDLQLIYEQKGRQLQEILNNRYGSCNFTSFVRYFVPQDYEHRYLAFIKHQPQNRLSAETGELVDRLIDEEYAKEATIRNWWEEVDRQVVFRGYCRPGDKHIPAPELKKYFTERECRLLLDRLDPNKTGAIAYEHFS